MSTMTKHSPSHVVVKLKSATPQESQTLQPNDALILMHLARHSQPDRNHLAQLEAMLSTEGKLIAKALLKEVPDSELPEIAVVTARALERWAQRSIVEVNKSRRAKSTGASSERRATSKAFSMA